MLGEDPTHIAALKLHARAAIDGDRAETAIRDMRPALTVAPRDPEVMTLTALAHERLGQRPLMGEQLALAVEASNRGKDESLRYASFLMQENRPDPAEGVIADDVIRDLVAAEPADDDALTIGRSRDNSIVLDDMLVSRRHLRITADDEGLLLEDLGSRNGTYVNGRRVERAHLQEGDRIGVGGTTFEVRNDWLVTI